MIAKAKQKKNGEPKRTDFLPLLLGVVFLLLAGILLFSNLQMAQRKWELSLRVAEMEKEINNLQKRNDTLKSNIASFSQESYLEKEAREKLQLKKPGEKVVTVLPPEATITPSPVKKPWNIFEMILEKLGL